jgi:TonB family protein
MRALFLSKQVRDRMRNLIIVAQIFSKSKVAPSPENMKFCPTCQTRYDEEILRFCTKDGTPLVEENQPNFTALPSENSLDDFGEETVIRRKPPATQPHFNEKQPSAPRIVIPTTDDARDRQARVRPTAYQAPPPKPSNTAKVVLLTILGTIVVLGGAGGIFWFLQSDKPSNGNNNVNILNVNTNPPTNLNIGNAFNYNLNANTNVAVNANSNVNKSPTPRPSPTPTPTPRPTPNANANVNAANTNSAAPPVNALPSPTATPRPTETAAPPSRPVNVGVLNGRAVNLPTPAYPSAARALRAAGRVTVQVLVDETGNVSSAKATSGHPLLRQAAEAAARQSRFNPILVNNQAVAASGILVYNFVN